MIIGKLSSVPTTAQPQLARKMNNNRLDSARSDCKMSNPYPYRTVSVRAIAMSPPPSAAESRKLTTSLYEVLQVKRDASQSQIKSAYRSLAKMYHPDASIAVSDGQEFIEIHKAYETLSDPAARNVYDLSLIAAAVAGSGGRTFGRSYANHSRFYKGQRWETDQCW